MNYLQYKLFIVPLSIVIGFILDLIIGDPQKFPHPVRVIGRFAKKIEPAFEKSRMDKKTSGALFASTVVISSWLFVIIMMVLLGLIAIYKTIISFTLILVFSSIVTYTCLAVKDLKIECVKVYNDLKNNDIGNARYSLSRIVEEIQNIWTKRILSGRL